MDKISNQRQFVFAFLDNFFQKDFDWNFTNRISILLNYKRDMGFTGSSSHKLIKHEGQIKFLLMLGTMLI